ncbi:hypothetical protein LJC01_00745 [Clostridiaceae bacterium OttesenSCG-928-D20]|nr:hypothetical protein [Clostridiaceae bacterium OttesenSCG-928-D20]
MKLAFELICERGYQFLDSQIIEMFLERGGEIIEGSRGTDIYTYNGMLLPGSAVCASGRRSLHEIAPDLFGLGGSEAVPVSIEPSPSDLENRSDFVGSEVFNGLRLWIETNTLISQGELQSYFSLIAHVDGREIPVSLNSSVTRINWHGCGRFCIELDFLGDLVSGD